VTNEEQQRMAEKQPRITVYLRQCGIEKPGGNNCVKKTSSGKCHCRQKNKIPGTTIPVGCVASAAKK
jgi:hypothetical protein